MMASHLILVTSISSLLNKLLSTISTFFMSNISLLARSSTMDAAGGSWQTEQEQRKLKPCKDGQRNVNTELWQAEDVPLTGQEVTGYFSSKT